MAPKSSWIMYLYCSIMLLFFKSDYKVESKMKDDDDERPGDFKKSL